MLLSLSFDDVIISPRFSTIASRKDVDISTNFLGMDLKLPIISSNMDTVTNSHMAKSMALCGGISALHRFQDTETNIIEYLNSPANTIVSIGLGDIELYRAKYLYNNGARNFLIDVAHGANIEVVKQYDNLREVLPEAKIIVGNFANYESIVDFLATSACRKVPDAIKVGIGGGSACTTRVVSGCGGATFSSIVDCAKSGIPIIADGGMRTSGDIAKALGAGTDEAPGYLYDMETKERLIGYSQDFLFRPLGKKYRGSASAESYVAQGKTSNYISPEGESFLVPYVGSLEGVLQQIAGGLRSALSYTGSANLTEFRENVVFKQLTHAGNIESGSHGKKE